MAKYVFARAYRGRQEHLTADRKTTLCGQSCKQMAKYDKQYGDSKARPLCPGCRAKKGK